MLQFIPASAKGVPDDGSQSVRDRPRRLGPGDDQEDDGGGGGQATA